jgi:hypothetical protein
METALSIFSKPWFGSALGILGILAAIVTYKLSQQRALPAYQQRGLALLGHNKTELPSEVEVRYRSRAIPRLTKSVIVFWNAGEKTIHGQDIVSSDPLRIETCEPSEVLSSVIIQSSRDAINFKIGLPSKGNSIPIVFDYLDSGDGAVIEVLHTSTTRTCTIRGTIRGVPAGVQDFGGMLESRGLPAILSRIPSRRGLLWAVFVVGAVVTAFGAAVPVVEFRQLNDELAPRLSIIGAGSLYVFGAGFLLWRTRRRYPASLRIGSTD